MYLQVVGLRLEGSLDFSLKCLKRYTCRLVTKTDFSWSNLLCVVRPWHNHTSHDTLFGKHRKNKKNSSKTAHLLHPVPNGLDLYSRYGWLPNFSGELLVKNFHEAPISFSWDTYEPNVEESFKKYFDSDPVADDDNFQNFVCFSMSKDSSQAKFSRRYRLCGLSTYRL